MIVLLCKKYQYISSVSAPVFSGEVCELFT